MQITVFGASGRVGKIVVELLLHRGCSVVGFVHSHNPFPEHKGLRIITGDITDKDAVLASLQDSEAVFSCLGSWGTPTKDILTNAMQSIIPVMEQTGLRRIISLTGSAAFLPNEPVSRIDTMNRSVLGFLQPKILADGEMHARLLHASSLEWTIIRSPVMINLDKSSYRLSSNLPAPWAFVTYRAVATAMVDQLNDKSFTCAAPAISLK